MRPHPSPLIKGPELTHAHSEAAKAAHPEAQRLLSLLDGKTGGGKPAPPPKSHGLTQHTTARAEIALTWLRAGFIAPLEAREAESGATAGGSGSGSGSGKGKGKARAVD